MRISDWSSDVCSSDLVYAHRFTPDSERRRASEDGREPGSIPFLKRYTVFSTDQCEGLPDRIAAPPPPVPEGLIRPEAEALIAATGSDFRIVGDRAFYSPGPDSVPVARPDASFHPLTWHCTDFYILSRSVGVRCRPFGQSCFWETSGTSNM